MLSKRTAICVVVMALALLVSAVLTELAFRVPAGTKLPENLTVGMGRVEMSQFVVDARQSSIHVSQETMTATGDFDWRSLRLEAAIGTIRIVALWSDAPPRGWSLGGACGYILDQDGAASGLISLPGLTTLSFADIHICNAFSRDSGRQYLYLFDLPESRCHTAGLVYARVPWQYIEADLRQSILNGWMEENKAKVFNALGAAYLKMDGPCVAAARRFAWSLILLPVGLFTVLCAFSVALWFRPAGSVGRCDPPLT
jgi:hypothetical protein